MSENSENKDHLYFYINSIEKEIVSRQHLIKEIEKFTSNIGKLMSKKVLVENMQKSITELEESLAILKTAL